MKKLLTVGLLAGTLGVTVTAALANPMFAPVAAPVPHVVTAPVNAVPVQTQVLNGYRAVRSFWLSRAIVR
jgi:hypothetical protein